MEKQWSFFQIIHPLIIQNQELGIPRRFVRKYAKDLSDVAVLEDPSNGKVWNVSLKRSGDGEIFFKNGWHDFIEYHSIRNGHFLVFRYHGNSVFHVRIYDITGCDQKGNEKRRQQGKEEGQRGDEKVASPHLNQEVVEMSSGYETYSEPPPRERATQFQSENHFCVVNVRSSYLKGSWMYLPYKFMETNAKKIDHLTLVVPNSGSEIAWRCQLLWYHHERRAMIYDGWKVFVAETNLKVGDVCVFELINMEHNVFNVSIFRD